MKTHSKRERTLLAELATLKAAYQEKPTAEGRAAIKAKSAEFHAAHVQAAKVLASLEADPPTEEPAAPASAD